MDKMLEEAVTAIGTPNIALIKYWGKRDPELNLPTNSSISITLDETLNTKTSVLFSDCFKGDRLFINGEAYDLKDTKNEKTAFTAKVLEHMRGLAGTEAGALIVSKNSFPTAGGLASSASGAATLCYAVSEALELRLAPKELSIVARRISGSACRSISGGFVEWRKGSAADGSDSYAESIANEEHWPEVIDIITLIEDKKKKVSSSEGHRRATETSELYQIRPKIADRRVESMEKAIEQRDFEALAEITMKDSNSLHATALDSFPPILYLNDTSKAVIQRIHELNQHEGATIAAYTFDAGPNAQIITLKKHKNKVIDAIGEIISKDRILVVGQGHGPRPLPSSESLLGDMNLL